MTEAEKKPQVEKLDVGSYEAWAPKLECLLMKKEPRCCGCNEIGHVRSNCPKETKKPPIAF
jgi:hypothetical protein